ncbi:membrane hypothetical protein [Xanthomonas citri pv. fuscans]|nr:membrane hypothetical protein [Xanthomonas citri pv. fuscans]SOO04450.1 membrane hypothetical protein [Xanthomonas citri pv. fuscans]SOO07427.1 membrane hypothetical protein [Xanthomonas citri pv. fuscans]SOO13518.1 membrane hypothetical protein [Xanthomonas citri pv. fuscans]SOO45593.1 membrane hypothetical protein [Xanthomonas citri pv. fuscans]
MVSAWVGAARVTGGCGVSFVAALAVGAWAVGATTDAACAVGVGVGAFVQLLTAIAVSAVSAMLANFMRLPCWRAGYAGWHIAASALLLGTCTLRGGNDAVKTAARDATRCVSQAVDRAPRKQSTSICTTASTSSTSTDTGQSARDNVLR